MSGPLSMNEEALIHSYEEMKQNGFDADIAGDWVIDSTPTIGQANL